MVAEARERQAAEAAKPRRIGATPPSRMPKDWKPEAFRRPREASLAPAAPHARAVPAVAGPEQAASPPASDTQSARTDLVPPGMPPWTAPQGLYVDPDDPPEVQEKFLRIEAQLRQVDRYLGPPIKRRQD
jgi:hypothetical protein